MIDTLYNGGLGLFAASWWTGAVWPVLWALIKIVAVLAPLMGAVAYLTLWERKLLGWIQVRHGTIRGILAQRLIRVICPACKQVDPMTASDANLISLGLKKDTVFYKGKGCEKCAHTGYYGRSGIFELLVVNDEIQQLIIKQADVMKISEAARRNGMITLIEDGGRKVAAGVTTVSEIFRVTQEV